MVWFHRDPFRSDWTQLQRNADRLFASLLPDAVPQGPPVRVFQDGDDIHMTVALPGVSSDALNVEVEGRVLTLSAQAPTDGEGDGERRPRFRRAFRLPYRIDPDAVEARLEHGLLRVRAQRLAADRPKSIPVHAQAD